MRSHIRVVPPLLWHFKLQGSSGGLVLTLKEQIEIRPKQTGLQATINPVVVTH